MGRLWEGERLFFQPTLEGGVYWRGASIGGRASIGRNTVIFENFGTVGGLRVKKFHSIESD